MTNKKVSKLTLMCIIPIGEDLRKLKFVDGKRYEVVMNYPNLISLIDEFGYKMNFSTREEDLNLLYIWDYFYEEDKELLESLVEKLV